MQSLIARFFLLILTTTKSRVKKSQSAFLMKRLQFIRRKRHKSVCGGKINIIFFQDSSQMSESISKMKKKIK
jgi:hypothetical protein